MNKVILSSLALLGLSVAFVAPAQAQAQPSVLVNSTNSQGSITGAAIVSNINGLTSAVAAQVTFPALVYAVGAIVTPVHGPKTQNDVNHIIIVENNDVNSIVLRSLTVTHTGTLATSELAVSAVETAVATKLGAAGITISDQVSLIRAWRSGLN